MGGAHQTRTPRSAFDDIHDALQAAGHSIRPRGSDAFMASCPLHTDHSPSLSVTWRESTPAGRGGAVLLHCFSCQGAAGDIAAALGMRLADLFDNPVPPAVPAASAQQRRRPAPGKFTRRAGTRGPLPARITIIRDRAEHVWRRVWVYTYTTIGGTPVQQVIREECNCNGQPHKRFQQRYRHGRQWVYRKPEGFTPVLYRPTAMRTAATTGEWIWITEGEKDADTLTALGRLATTNAQGAASFPDQLVSQFHGLKVAIVADRDLAGYQRAIGLYQQLQQSAAQVAVLLPGLEADKADMTDHAEAGLWRAGEPFGGLVRITVDDLHALAVGAGARWAGDRFDVAVAEARAHRGRHGTVAGSAHAAARWLAEAADQLRTVQRGMQNLQRHATQHPSPIASMAADTVAALCERLENDYRHPIRRARTAAGSGYSLKVRTA
jgi:hypothetical protein